MSNYRVIRLSRLCNRNTLLFKQLSSDSVSNTAINITEIIKSNEIENFPLNRIRNFSVIAHVDHGKSTLSDSLLHHTGNINERDRKKGQVLDTLQVERERGITVKAQSASMVYIDTRSNERYLLNLIDTPGHVDFSYEVTRSLASCQGALLLVDSTQSIQAQTISNHKKAVDLGLVIIPVVSKIDLPTSQPLEVAIEIGRCFSIDPDLVVMTSAKNNIGIRETIESVIDRIPSPKPIQLVTKYSDILIARVVDSWFDDLRGVIILIQILNGSLVEGQRISILSSQHIDSYSTSGQIEIDKQAIDFSIQEVGYLTPTSVRSGRLIRGHVGYVVSGMRSTKQARVGDIVYLPNQITTQQLITQLSTSLPIYLSNQSTNNPVNNKSSLPDNLPMLFVSIYPVDSTEIDKLIDAVDRLCLTDPSVSVKREQSTSLGVGLRIGFLGYLHMEVFNQRLQDEHNLQVVVTTPSVPYLIRYNDKQTIENSVDKLADDVVISNLSDWPDSSIGNKAVNIYEPIVSVNLTAPSQFYGEIVDLLKHRRAYDLQVNYLDKQSNNKIDSQVDSDLDISIECFIPWQEVVFDLHDQIKHLTSGYATFSYVDKGYVRSDLVKVDITINGEICDPLSVICHSSRATEVGRRLAVKLREVLDRQQFEIVIQAKVNSKVLAKERLAPYRKDVLVKSGKLVGGGDVTRKKKLLEKQKEGKKRAKMIGRVEVSQEAFWTVLQK